MAATSKYGESWIDRLPRRTRRVIAVGALAGLPAMYAWSAFWLTTAAPKIAWGPVSFVLIGFTVFGSLVLYRFVRDRADMRARLDERQSQLRDRALVLCYQVLSALIVLAVVVLGVLVLGRGRAVTVDATFVGALAISVGVSLLPVAALAWLEPDFPAEI